MTLLYRFSVFLFQQAIRTAAFFGNAKAGKWVEGRKNIFSQIQSMLNPGEARTWFHCASLGEFEQGRPLMEKLKQENPQVKIVLTFFSPSGYEIRKNYSGADYVFYLPMDSPKHAERFISLINPSKVFFIKYEFWFYYLSALRKLNIPVYLVSAIFRSGQPFFKWYGGFYKKMLKSFTHIFLQDDSSTRLLHSIGFSNHTVAGDTRFDRVVEAAANVNSISILENFKNSQPLIIAGSTWKEDEDAILVLFNELKTSHSSFKLVVAPHEIDERKINDVVKLFSAFKTEKFSEANEKTIGEFDVLVIDNIGLLSSIYQYGNYGYIGGGFGKGIHNVLEAAVFGMPVFFGPNYEKFREAKELISHLGAFSVQSTEELRHVFLKLVNDKNLLTEASVQAKKYVYERRGATEKIVEVISKSI